MLGRDIFESNNIEKLRERDSMLDDFFSVTHHDMDSSIKDEKDDKVERAIFHCNNITPFIPVYLEKRGLWEGEVHHKIGLDGGGTSVKLCLNTILNKGSFGEPDSKKMKFSYQQGVLQKGFRDGGVKKLFILGLVEKVTESAHNLQTLLELADV